MKRKIYKLLLDWKQSKYRKPLILNGARQTGKTYIVNVFGQNEYDNVIYCNLEQESNLKNLFDGDLITNEILEQISLIKNQKINPHNTLLILDEVQACPRAITFLKYINEQANRYHVIATGSLLGLAINRKDNSYPVGKVDHLTLYPLDFEEFLMALGREDLVLEIKKCYMQDKRMNTMLHEQLMKIYKTFLYIGGMPEVVVKYLETKNNTLVQQTQQNIVESYLRDMAKYNDPTDYTKTLRVYSSISSHLSKENKKFKYSELKKGARAKDYEYSLEWICMTGLAAKIYCLDHVISPLNTNCNLDCFKLYANDCGLLVKQKNISPEEIINDMNLNYFKGGLTENYVFNQLRVNNLETYYWTSGNTAEVDFITKINNSIIPIETKSNIHNKSKSLNVYIQKHKPKYSIRITAKNFGFENKIKSVPLYAVFCIKNEER